MDILKLFKKNLHFILFLVYVFLVAFFSGLFLHNNDSQNVSFETPSHLVLTPTLAPKDKKVSLVLTGDVMLGRNVMGKSVKNSDFTYPFLNVYRYLTEADIVFVNLENPVISDCPKIDSGFTFCSLPESVEGLLFAGVDVVSLANNHTQNFGLNGLTQTEKLLREAGILVTGTGKLATKEIGDLKFGFLGFDFTVHEPTLKDYELIKASDSTVDILLVAVHWGVEYEDTPRDFQREWARLMTVNGADIVVGNHPHWIQGAECFENGESMGYTKANDLELFSCLSGKGSVYYALGNFVFDQMWSEETKKGALVKLDFLDGVVTGNEVKRTYIREIGQPEFVD